MSEPKTIREVLTKKRVGAKKLSEPQRPSESAADHTERLKYSEGFMDGMAYTEGRFEEVCILDYHIIPGADAVVTPQGLEGAAAAIARLYGWELPASTKCPTYLVDRYRVFARAAIEAAGIEVVDEGPLRVQEYPESQAVLVDGGLVELWTGDTLFIKRAATGKEDGDE